MTHTISMPLHVYLPRKTMPDKKYILNLNYFLHWKPIVSNMVKKAYAEIAAPKLAGIKAPDGRRVTLTLTLYKGSRRKIDRANPLSIAEKFLCDAMVDAGVIPDDNDDYIAWTRYESGPMDRDNPRVEITIGLEEAP